MARGFLSGLVVGGLVSAFAAGVASVMAPGPRAPQVSDAAPGVAAPERIGEAASGETGSETDPAVQTGRAGPQAPAPDPDTLASIDDETLAPADQPQTGEADRLDQPATATDSAAVAPETDEPVLPNPQALAPMAPQEADDLSISTEPARQPQPAAETDSAAFASPEGAEEASPDAPGGEMPAPETGTAEVSPPAPEVTVAPKIETEAAEAPAAPVEAPREEPLATITAPETEVPSEAPETPPAETESAALAPPTRPTVGTPGVSLINRESDISVRRPGTGPEEDAAAEASEAAPVSDLRPIERFAQPFTPEEGKPLMSIVLIDDGNSPVTGSAGLAALRSFPYPLTFAVDAEMPGAAERMALYREAGFEVLAMLDLPEGAQPEDVETTFAALLPEMSEVVGVLGAPSGRLQTSREVSDQVTAYLAETGHGWLTQGKGLNTAVVLARREGVPAAAIFRDFDSKGQTAVVIRRFLDQAAFKAGQESGVIMLGRMQPETISALLLWGLQDRAGQVALAPISAVLLAD
ncbi:MAG: polysaccharide deacteylase family 2 protein [Sulfitobacter sp.]|nr:polysaccharide deacteylase family 2 protein [Sulfitobacter sp.]